MHCILEGIQCVVLELKLGLPRNGEGSESSTKQHVELLVCSEDNDNEVKKNNNWSSRLKT